MNRQFQSEISHIQKKNTQQCINLLVATETILLEISNDLLQILTTMTQESRNIRDVLLSIESFLHESTMYLQKKHESILLFGTKDDSPINWQSYITIEWKRPVLQFSKIESIYQLIQHQQIIDKEIFHHYILEIIDIRESILKESRKTSQMIERTKRYLTYC